MIFRPFDLMCLCTAFIIGASTCVLDAAQAADRRLGLVIGEAGYKAGALSTPADDAGVIAQALASDGFDVTGYADLDLTGIRRAFGDFLAKARDAGPDAVVFVYLAGYGLQFRGDDFLVPVDARIARDVDVPGEAVRLSDLSRGLAGLPLKARVLVYDLARPHPFARGGSPLASGLAMVDPRAGSLVAFNTGPGLVAPVEHGHYGLYAQALSEMLRTEGLGIETVFARLRARVDALSNGTAVPWVEGVLEAPFVLQPPATDAPSLLSPFRALMPGGSADAYWVALQHDTLAGYTDFLKAYPRDPLGARIAVLLAARREAATWAQTRRANIASAYWTYMRRYPRGPHFADARRGLAALSAALEPPPRFDLYVYSDLPAPRPEELALINQPFVLLDVDDDAPVPPPPATLVPERRAAFYDRLPPLLAVSAGTLPLTVQRGAASGSGRIVQPDFSGPGGPVVATSGLDKTGDPSLRQTGPDDRVLSAAIMSSAPNGGSIVTQTGPDGRLVLKTTVVVGPNGGRTVTQTGSDKRVISTVMTLVAANGNHVTTVSGADGLPLSIGATTAAGTVINQPRGVDAFRVAAPTVITRPVVVSAPPRSGVPAAAPPLLATGRMPAATTGTVAPTIGTAASSPRSSPPVPVVDAPQSLTAPVVPQKDVAAPVNPTLPSIVPTTVAEPVVPVLKPVAPITVPTIAVPTIATPAAAPSSAAAAPAPLPLAPAVAPPPTRRPAEPQHEPAPLAEPVPPRKGSEPASVKTMQPAPVEAHREKPIPAPASQPTPPHRPKVAAPKAAATKATLVRTPPKAQRPAKAAPKKATGGGRVPVKRRG